MSLVLEGTLSDVGLCDLLRLIAREKRSGALRVTIDGRSLRFGLRDGYLTGVVAEDDPQELAIEPAVLSLVRYRRGAFRLEPPNGDDPEGGGEPPAGGEHAEVLAGAGDMELLRFLERLDDAGGEAARAQRAAFPTPRQMEALAPDPRAVYALVDGERSIGELIARSRLDPEAVLDALDLLARESMVTIPLPEPPPVARAAPRSSSATGAWRDWLAAAVPLVMLCGWLALSGPGVRVEASDPFEIRPDPLAAARAEHELERLRAVVEAHRFAEGRWPEDLEALVARGYVSEAALTDSRGRPYYYALRDDEFVLLAPER